jgi:diguanylate cyclase (GGDEF)-like protein/PAS domain S-box-containing protein
MVSSPAWRSCVALAGLALALAASSPLAAAVTPRFGRLSVEQGLPQSTVQAIVQDHVGFLWFGTEEGLSRFDGYTSKVFKFDAKDPASLPHDRVTALYEDRQRRLWVGTDGGLARFDRQHETFTRETKVAAGRIMSLAEEPNGRIWVAVEGTGVYARDPASGAFKLYEPRPDDPNRLASWLPSVVLVDRRGWLWVATRNVGLERLERGPAGERFVHYRHDPQNPDSLNHDEIWGLAEDRAGRIWVATYGGGLDVLDPGVGTFKHYRRTDGGPHPLGNDQVTAVFVDHAGAVWAGTDGAGLQQYDPASDGFISHRHDASDPGSISADVIRCLYEDRQGQLWAGTFLEGASHVRKARYDFSYFTHNPMDSRTLPSPNIYSFVEDGAGRLWVSTAGGWLARREEDGESFARYALPHGESGALTLFKDRLDRVWIGTYRAGLDRFDPERGVVTHTYRRQAGAAGTLSNDEVWTIAEDESGALWLGTNDGLDRFDPTTGTVVGHYDTPSADLASNAGVRALLRDRRGTLWVGTLGGLHRLPRGGGKLERIHAEDRSLQRDGVVALTEDRAGNVWVGTYGGGLKRIDPATGALTTFERFPSNVIYGIQEDAKGRLWLSTNRGLVRFAPASGAIETFDLSNGLQSLQFSLGASYRSRDGRALFGSVGGFYEFDPDGISADVYAPPVVLTGVRLANEPMPLPAAASTLDEITLSHRDKVVTLEFAALEYSMPKRNRYACRLEGFTNGWLELGTRREVTFTNLDPGRYRFEVKASNSDGVWSPASTATLALIVRPPFWGTWWFRALAVALFALALVGSHRARLHHVTARWVERQRSDLELRQAQEKYREIFENATEGIFQALPDGRLVTANPALARMLGAASPAELLTAGAPFEGWLSVEPDRRRELLRLLTEDGIVQGFECELRHGDGSTLWIAATIRAVRDAGGAVARYEGSLQDVSDRKRSEEQIHFQAYHDALTGLPNRLLLQDRLTQALAYAQRRHGTLALLFLDLDAFKLINDSLGHAVGDRLLRAVGERLSEAVRLEDTVARVGGDEFLLLLPHLAATEDAARTAQKLLDTFATPFSIDGHELHVSASVGAALFPDDGTDADTLLRNADAAMYFAKESGRNNYQLCTRALTARAVERLSLERELRRALDRNEFTLVYQPQVDLVTGRIVGAEALVRWQHPERGLVLPGTFIPVAEESRLIVPLGAWVLDTACRQLRVWRDAGFDTLRLSVNISGRQLPQQDLSALVTNALLGHGIPAERLELEITESVAMQNVEWTQGQLVALRKLGVRLAIDDFGTGQSSLSYLRHFPLSALKIDRSFVEDIGVDAVDEAIVRAVIALAHSVDLTVVAEGVATAEQLAFLRAAGCDEGQGHLFSKPIPAEELGPFLVAERMAV